MPSTHGRQTPRPQQHVHPRPLVREWQQTLILLLPVPISHQARTAWNPRPPLHPRDPRAMGEGFALTAVPSDDILRLLSGFRWSSCLGVDGSQHLNRLLTESDKALHVQHNRRIASTRCLEILLPA
eukprot:6115332-Amphidinium_carterae.1